MKKKLQNLKTIPVLKWKKSEFFNFVIKNDFWMV